jgi:triosephosphate isomerase
MLADAGATHVIVGHSERRTDHGETDAMVRAKAAAALAAGLTPIVCVGETLAERDAGQTLDLVARQLDGALPAARDRLVIAYEPVWAIGTGRTPTLEQVAEVHAAIAARVPGVPILYGGSVNPDNAAGLLGVPHVGGALVGGASLKASSFLAIARAAQA